MADIFEEVEEQLRSDRYISMVKKGWPFAAGVAGAALLAALAVWGWDQYQASISAKASETYNAGLEALAKGDQPAADKAFAEVAKTGPRGYRALALMQEAALKQADKPADALSLFDEAAKVAPDKVLGDMARIKAALTALDMGQALPQLEGRLTPLVAPDRPYRIMAREALAMARLANGKTAEAKADFTAITLLPDATDTARARAQAAVSLIDTGAAAGLPAALKVARTLPKPSMPLPPNLMGQAGAPTGVDQ